MHHYLLLGMVMLVSARGSMPRARSGEIKLHGPYTQDDRFPARTCRPQGALHPANPEPLSAYIGKHACLNVIMAAMPECATEEAVGDSFACTRKVTPTKGLVKPQPDKARPERAQNVTAFHGKECTFNTRRVTGAIRISILKGQGPEGRIATNTNHH